MNLYVLGFAFDDLGRVALVEKARPDWQAGKLNGIGGLIEFGETPHGAMVREFREETGVEIHHWEHVGHMKGSDWDVSVFTVTSPKVRCVTTCTDEIVMLHLPDGLRLKQCIENVIALVHLCSITPQAPSWKRPNFVLYY